MFRSIRVILWGWSLELQNWLYPYDHDPEEDYYYRVKNDLTGEEHFIMDWVKSFDERIVGNLDDILWLKSEVHRLSDEVKSLQDENIGLTNALYEAENRLESKIDQIHPVIYNIQDKKLDDFTLGDK
jgi:hypothetical protein